MRRDPPKGFHLPPLSLEPVPDSPPDSGIKFLATGSDCLVDGSFLIVGSITAALLESAWRLVELSYAHQGRFSEGMAVPDSCRAAATGAIAVACAAFEAVLNEALFQAHTYQGSIEGRSQNKLLDLLLKVTPRERLEGIAALAHESIEWGKEPFQSLAQLLSVRKHLLHHEPDFYIPAEGLWPAKQLRDLPRKIGSPYSTEPRPDGPPLQWSEHIFTPAGAEWAVRCVYDIVATVDVFERVIRDRFPGNVVYGSPVPIK
jgi:hypothetical protein